LCLALASRAWTRSAIGIGDLLKPSAQGFSGFKDALGKVAQSASVPPKHMKGAA